MCTPWLESNALDVDPFNARLDVLIALSTAMLKNAFTVSKAFHTDFDYTLHKSLRAFFRSSRNP